MENCAYFLLGGVSNDNINHTIISASSFINITVIVILILPIIIIVSLVTSPSSPYILSPAEE